MWTRRSQSEEVISRKALDQMRSDVGAIVREMEIQSLIANGVPINEAGIDLAELEGQRMELKGLLDNLGRGDEWEKIRSDACRRFPFKRWETGREGEPAWKGRSVLRSTIAVAKQWIFGLRL